MKMVVAPIFAFLLQLSFAFAAPPIALPDSTSIFIPDNSHNTTSPANASLVDPVG